MSRPQRHERDGHFEKKGGYPSGTKPIAELPKIPASARSSRSAPQRSEPGEGQLAGDVPRRADNPETSTKPPSGRRSAARQRLAARYGLRADGNDRSLAGVALDALREAVSKRRSLTDDEAAALVAEKARQKRIEKRAHDTET